MGVADHSSAIPILLLNLKLSHIIAQCGKVNILILIQNLFHVLCFFVQFQLSGHQERRKY